MFQTILLVQPGTRSNTRTYGNFNSIDECMEGLCRIYEAHLAMWNPSNTQSYDLNELFQFIDQLADLKCLVFQKSTKTYAGYDKAWIKEKIYSFLLHRIAT